MVADYKKLSPAEWEAVCSRCGRCCLVKLQDEETDEVCYTNIVCRYYDLEQNCCSVYDKRCQLVPTCLKLTPENVDKLPWMPKVCAYRRLFEKNFKPQTLKPLAGRVVKESEVNEDELEEHIVEWTDL